MIVPHKADWEFGKMSKIFLEIAVILEFLLGYIGHTEGS